MGKKCTFARVSESAARARASVHARGVFYQPVLMIRSGLEICSVTAVTVTRRKGEDRRKRGEEEGGEERRGKEERGKEIKGRRRGEQEGGKEKRGGEDRMGGGDERREERRAEERMGG